MRTTTKLFTIFAMGLAALATATSKAPAQQGGTTGKVTVTSKSIAVGVGVNWGEGVLTYHGKKYPFTVNGLSVIDLGISKVTAVGDVKNLKKLEDFNGNYVSASAGAAAGGGAGAAALKNQNGVEMALHATTKGVKLSLAGSGVEVKLKQ